MLQRCYYIGPPICLDNIIPKNITEFRIALVGGGGAGSVDATDPVNLSGGAGGGGGACVMSTISFRWGQGGTLTIGAGGNPLNGSKDGGATTLADKNGSPIASADGGKGAVNNTPGAGGNPGACFGDSIVGGGSGGTGSGNDYSGGAGSAGFADVINNTIVAGNNANQNTGGAAPNNGGYEGPSGNVSGRGDGADAVGFAPQVGTSNVNNLILGGYSGGGGAGALPDELLGYAGGCGANGFAVIYFTKWFGQVGS